MDGAAGRPAAGPGAGRRRSLLIRLRAWRLATTVRTGPARRRAPAPGAAHGRVEPVTVRRAPGRPPGAPVSQATRRCCWCPASTPRSSTSWDDGASRDRPASRGSAPTTASGSGTATRRRGGRRVADLADELDAVMTALGLQRPVVARRAQPRRRRRDDLGRGSTATTSPAWCWSTPPRRRTCRRSMNSSRDAAPPAGAELRAEPGQRLLSPRANAEHLAGRPASPRPPTSPRSARVRSSR